MEKLEKVLERYADLIYVKWEKYSKEKFESKNLQYKDTIISKLSLLEPTKHEQECYAKHEKSKLKAGILIVFTILFLGVLVTISNSKGELNGLEILRNDYGQGEKQVDLEATYQGKSKDYSLKIQDRKYSEKEILSVFEEEFSRIEKAFLKENSDYNAISKSVNMPDSVRNGLIKVNWRLSDYDILDGQGNINEDALESKLSKLEEDSFPMEVTIVLSYENIKREKTFNCAFVKREYQGEEALEKSLNAKLKEIEETQKTSDTYQLPEEIEGVSIEWSEKKSGGIVGIILLGVVGIIAVFVGKDFELDRKVKDRNLQMELDYPEFVSKLTLMISAGVSLFNAWSRISEGYLEEKNGTDKNRYIYEEMVITMREIQSGEEEIKAFENFGERVMVPCYKKFSSILVQSMKKGMGALQENLEFEVRQAFEIRKANALRLGEEASTKLLLPMGLMLLIVLVIIIAPAFMSITI